MRAALEVLAAGGIIDLGGRGKRRAILRKPGVSEAPRSKFTVLLCRTLEDSSWSTQALIRHLDRAAEKAGYTISIRHLPGAEESAVRLAELVAEENADLWVLVEPSQIVATWFDASEVRALASGGSIVGTSLRSVAYDGAEAVRAAVERLSADGHRHLALLNEYRPSLEDEAFAQSIAAKGSDHHGVRLDVSGDSEQLVHSLRSVYAGSVRPAGLIVIGIRNLVTLVSWMGSEGYRTPSEASVIFIGSDPLSAAIHPRPARFDGKPEHLAREIALAVEESLQSPVDKFEDRLLKMPFIEGSTLQPIVGT